MSTAVDVGFVFFCIFYFTYVLSHSRCCMELEMCGMVKTGGRVAMAIRNYCVAFARVIYNTHHICNILYII